ncbi:transporter substrate-binding domain-containing protein [Rhodoferax sp.]|uniref:transporter substrate-binding domain-containing protein n=1 Tax=Rhodoferax sp. TaxID=50421 RepID=UPI00262FFE5A|nr:transporter substrate-binding domain-containing protein [Rhodoferax sp.]MDD2926305.1 transporter substrate-binding domain-containing protein [Rhodoferax sp.]MDD5481305.1 transporter substrate-binding domain-containing protein [Rhodoferax sp.]
MTKTNRRNVLLGSAALLGSAITVPTWAQNQADMATWERIASSKTLRIAAVAGGAPNYHKDLATGQWSGIMIDLANDLAAKLGVKLEIRETTWGNSVLDLQSNKIDIFFGLNPTPQRMKVISFSEPLYNNAYSLIAKKGFNPKTWEEMDTPEVTIAVDVGSSYDNLVTAMYKKAKILRFEKSADATLAVQTGRADVQPLVVTLSAGIVKKNPGIGHVVVPEPIKGTSTNAGLRMETDQRWKTYVDGWIAELRKSGAINTIVLGNLDKLMSIKREEIPAIVSF